MVFVKVRETYDLQTIKNKMSVIAIHTPKPAILKRNYPGLLMQCKAYRPYSCDVRLACASVLPLDPRGVGTTTDAVAPEDMFNPILYKAMSNFGMSQLEARINNLAHAGSAGTSDIYGDSAEVDVDSMTNISDEFNVYYGLLANTHEWKHASPQAGLSMKSLRPLVYEKLYNVGDNPGGAGNSDTYAFPSASSTVGTQNAQAIRGYPKPLPMINCTAYGSGATAPGFSDSDIPTNHAQEIPWVNCVVGTIIVPPSKLHTLFYRMVVEWTIEFSMIRPISDLASFPGVALIGQYQHLQNYSYTSTKEALTGDSSTILDNDQTMVSANVNIDKVM